MLLATLCYKFLAAPSFTCFLKKFTLTTDDGSARPSMINVSESSAPVAPPVTVPVAATASAGREQMLGVGFGWAVGGEMPKNGEKQLKDVCVSFGWNEFGWLPKMLRGVCFCFVGNCWFGQTCCSQHWSFLSPDENRPWKITIYIHLLERGGFFVIFLQASKISVTLDLLLPGSR